MAVHASLGGGNVGETGGLYRGVAVTAVQPHGAYVMRMAEGHRLFASLCGARLITAAIDLRERPREKSENENSAEYQDSRKCVRAVMKDLGHITTYVPAC
jgi:hypothetical protein